MTVLDLHVLPRAERSRTRKLRAAFFESFEKVHGAEPRIELDLAQRVDELPKIDEWDVEAKFEVTYGAGELDETLAQRWDALSRLTDQLHLARLIVVSTPMWNFSIPWHLKRWIDCVVQARLTFQFDGKDFSGLLKDKRVIVLTTRDGVYTEGTPAAAMDHQLPYLRWVFSFMGCTDFTAIAADGMAWPGREQSLDDACARARALAATL
jgi:FMN-dependent NADH-azoreductase